MRLICDFNKPMLYKLPNPILTERTLDTPYSHRSPANQKYHYQQPNQQINVNQYLQEKRKNFTNKQNSLSQQNKNFSISHQYNENTINTSKNRSLPHQEQNSLNFIKTKNKKLRTPNVTLDLNNKSIPQKSHSQDKVIKRSLSKKTEKINFNKTSVYLQQVKQRRILQNYDTVQQVSLANLSQQFRSTQLKHEPKLNVEVCLQYLNMNDSTSFAHLNRSQQISFKKNSSEDYRKIKKRDKLFPKQKKYLDQTIAIDRNGIKNDYYSNNLPINSKTIQLSKRYNFELKVKKLKKHSNEGNFANLSKPISISLRGDLSKKENDQSEIVPYFMRSTEMRESRQANYKKTQRAYFSQNGSSMLLLGNKKVQQKKLRTQNNQSNLNKRNLTQAEHGFTIVENVPLNIIIQQEDLQNVEIQERESGIEDYCLEPGPKTYIINKSTKVFICKYCLQVYSIFEIRYHKGQVCNIAYKQTQFIQKIKKVASFLTQTYESYYQMKPFYEFFKDLAKKIQLKLDSLQNEDKFMGLCSRIRGILSLKQNYHLLRGYKSSQRDRFMIQKIQEILHFEELLEFENVFEAVYGMIDLGNKNSTQGPIHRQKIIIVKHLFWLIRKLFEGLVLEKIKQIQL